MIMKQLSTYTFSVTYQNFAGVTGESRFDIVTSASISPFITFVTEGLISMPQIRYHDLLPLARNSNQDPILRTIL
jgi:hypothetical protein